MMQKKYDKYQFFLDAPLVQKTQMAEIPSVCNEDLVVVKFTAEWCDPCKMIDPDVERLTTEMGFYYDRIDIDKECNAAIVETFDIKAVPTFMIYVHGTRTHTVLGADTYKVRIAMEEALKTTCQNILECRFQKVGKSCKTRLPKRIVKVQGMLLGHVVQMLDERRLSCVCEVHSSAAVRVRRKQFCQRGGAVVP